MVACEEKSVCCAVCVFSFCVAERLVESIAVVCALVGKRTEGFGKSMVGNNRLRHKKSFDMQFAILKVTG